MLRRLEHIAQRVLTIVVCCALLGSAAWARGADPKTASAPGGPGPTGFLDELSFTSGDQPIKVNANEMEFDYDEQRLVYRGKVQVTQGELTLDCATLTVKYARAEGEKAELQEVVAEGDVVITQGQRRATGNRAIFDQTTRQIVLLGDPVLRDGQNEVQGDRLIVYLDEGRSVVEAGPKKRVSAVLYPGQLENGGKPGAAPAASPPTQAKP